MEKIFAAIFLSALVGLILYSNYDAGGEIAAISTTGGFNNMSLNETNYLENKILVIKDAQDCTKCGGIYNQLKKECIGTACF